MNRFSPAADVPAVPAAVATPEPDPRDLPAAVEPAGDMAMPPSLEAPMRPRMPMRDTKAGGNRKPLFIFLGIGIVAMLGMGLLAMNRMGKPERQDGPPVVTAPGETGTDPAKTEGRLAGAENQPTTQVAPPASAPDTTKASPARRAANNTAARIATQQCWWHCHPEQHWPCLHGAGADAGGAQPV